MAITFDLLNQFQENNFFQTPHLWKPWPYKLEAQKNTCLALIIQIMQLKQIF